MITLLGHTKPETAAILFVVLDLQCPVPEKLLSIQIQSKEC